MKNQRSIERIVEVNDKRLGRPICLRLNYNHWNQIERESFTSNFSILNQLINNTKKKG